MKFSPFTLLLLAFLPSHSALTCPSARLSVVGPTPEHQCLHITGSSSKRRKYQEFVDVCSAYGMETATITSSEEVAYVTPRLHGNTWIGLDYNRGRWKSTGAASLYFRWSSGNPSGRGENCVEMYSNSRWNDNECGEDRYFICAICAMGAGRDPTTSACTPCLEGTASADSKTCQLCPAGTSSPPASMVCTSCPAGTYSTSGSLCMSCPNGTISQAGAKSCTPCDPGFYSNPEGTHCIPCPDGQYSQEGADACTPCGTLISHWTGGGLQSNCQCAIPWAGEDCDISACPNVLRVSLLSLYLQSLSNLKELTLSFSNTTDEDTLEVVQNTLQTLVYQILDKDGNQLVTTDETLTCLDSQSISSPSLNNLPLWCPDVSDLQIPCVFDEIPAATLLRDFFSNFVHSPFHEFDGSGSSIFNSFDATFPSPDWTDEECATHRDTAVDVNWMFVPNRPALARVCGYTNGFLNRNFNGTSTVISGTSTMFTDSQPITASHGFKRVYCLRVEYCSELPSDSVCVSSRSDYTWNIVCTAGLRYEDTPIDLVPTLTETGITFSYVDTALVENRFDIFVGKNRYPSTHIVSVPYSSEGCGRTSNHISFADRINADLVGMKLNYGVRALLSTGITTPMTTVDYRIPFIGTVTGFVKTSTGAPVANVSISLCHIDPKTGSNDTFPTFCPLSKVFTDERGFYTADLRVAHPRWTSLHEQFRVIPSMTETIDQHTIAHTFSPSDFIITVKHRSSTTISFTDETSVSIRGNVRFHPKLVNDEECPFSGVAVMFNSSRGEITTTTTDESGHFLFSVTRRDSGSVFIMPWNNHTWISMVTVSSLSIPSPQMEMTKYLRFGSAGNRRLGSFPLPPNAPFKPTLSPTANPSVSPSLFPSSKPSSSPSLSPSVLPTISSAPTNTPSLKPTRQPTFHPTTRPTASPTVSPTIHYLPGQLGLLYDFDFDNTAVSDSVIGSGVSIADGRAVFSGGNNSYIRLPQGYFRDAHAVTVELWVEFGLDNDFSSYLCSFGPIGHSISLLSGYSGASHYLAVVLSNNGSATVGKVYRDGVLVSLQVQEEQSLLGGLALNDDNGFLGRSPTEEGLDFIGSIDRARIWWGELSSDRIFEQFSLGDQEQSVALLPSMTIADVEVTFLITSVQEVEIGFYGRADNLVQMFSDAVTFDIKSTTCPYSLPVNLGIDGEPFVGKIAAMNYTISMNNFSYVFPEYSVDLTPVSEDSKNPPQCAPDLHPFDYVIKSGQEIQTLTILNVTNGSYVVDFIYRSGMCMFVEGTRDFSQDEFPLPRPTPSPTSRPTTAEGSTASPTIKQGMPACFPENITVLKEEVPYAITVFLFERYPTSSMFSDKEWVFGTQLLDATLTIFDLVGGMSLQFTVPYTPTANSSYSPQAGVLGYPYTITPKNPRIDYPYNWKFFLRSQLEISTDHVSTLSSTWFLPVVGVLTNPFSTILPVASDPTLIFLVLRDPPGGTSYTTIETGTSVDFALSLEGMTTHDLDLETEDTGGVGLFSDETTPLFGTKFLEVNSILAGFGGSHLKSKGVNRLSSTHYQYSFEFSSEFSTSQLPDDAGHASDVIVGGGVDLFVLEGTEVKSRFESGDDEICFYSAPANVWSPGKLTTFVLSVREIENVIDHLTDLSHREENVTHFQLERQIQNWNEVLRNYRIHNEDMTQVFSVDDILLNREINKMADTLEDLSLCEKYLGDTNLESNCEALVAFGKTISRGASDIWNTLSRSSKVGEDDYRLRLYELKSQCQRLSHYKLATAFCEEFRVNNWITVDKAISSGACNLLVPSRDPDADPLPLSTFALFQSYCKTQSENEIDGLPGGALKNVKNSLFGFLSDSTKYLTFGAGSEMSFSYSSNIANSLSSSTSLWETNGDSLINWGYLTFSAGKFHLEANHRAEWGDSKTTEDTMGLDSTRGASRTIRVTLGDENPGDIHVVRITSDSVFGTPVFTPIGGQTSCPAETATLARESRVTIQSITPRCGGGGAPGPCTNLVPGETAYFTIRIYNDSPTRDTASYNIGFQSMFDEAPSGTTYEYCAPGQSSGLKPSFSSTTLEDIPYQVPIEVSLSVSNNGPCHSFQQIVVSITSACETGQKYQYEAERNSTTGTVDIRYDKVSAPLNSVAAFDVSWLPLRRLSEVPEQPLPTNSPAALDSHSLLLGFIGFIGLLIFFALVNLILILRIKI